MSSDRFHYMDFLKVVLFFLIIVQESLLVYGTNSDACYYSAAIQFGGDLRTATEIIRIINHTFLVPLLFLMSGMLAQKILSQREPHIFVRQRLYHVGIPLVFYVLIIDPAVKFIIAIRQGTAQGFTDFVTNNIPMNIGTGPMWFLAELLCFDMLYVLYKKVDSNPDRFINKTLSQIVVLRASIYVFVVGSLIWIHRLRISFSLIWIICALITLPFLLASMHYGGGIHIFAGGVSPQALFFAIWEAMLCMGMCMLLMSVSFKFVNKENVVVSQLSRLTYAAFIVHPIMIVLATFATEYLPVNVSVRCLLTILLAFPTSLATAALLKLIPPLKRIL